MQKLRLTVNIGDDHVNRWRFEQWLEANIGKMQEGISRGEHGGICTEGDGWKVEHIPVRSDGDQLHYEIQINDVAYASLFALYFS